MHPIPQTIRAIICAVIWLPLFLSFPTAARSQAESAAHPALRVGLIEAPPLAMKMAHGEWQGFSVELWQAVAQYLNVPYEYRAFDSLERLFGALESREIDVIPSLAVRESLESQMDFSQSYLKSGLAIAVPVEPVEFRWLSLIEGIFSRHILKAIGLLVAMSLIAGILVWLFEKRRNSEMFGSGVGQGIGQGIWWAMVTMTTVGYGDKAPKTFGGRVTALVWMIFSIVFIAVFTANITASLTLHELRGKVRDFNDLYHVRVGSIPHSEGFDFLSKHGITSVPVDGIAAGLQAVAGREIDAFVFDQTILKHLIKTQFSGRVRVLPETFDEYFVSVALQQRSPLRKPINKALLKFMKTDKWEELEKRYLK